MSNVVCFSNPGEIDIRLVTTMGVNVKASDSPIGYFGTGLKYAIAVLLREGQEVTIDSGLQEYAFRTKKAEIRGKEFEFIILRKEGGEEQELGFTTELGKNWSLENAYRELYSNCLDEDGEVWSGERPGVCEKEKTTICVEGEDFLDVHRRRWSFLLDPEREPLERPESAGKAFAEVYAGASNRVFYRGIAAYAASEPLPFTINILQNMNLSEDRQMDSWTVDGLLAEVSVKLKRPELIQLALGVKGKRLSENVHLSYTNEASEEVLSTIEGLMRTEPLNVSDRVRALYYNLRPKAEAKRKELKLCAEMQRELEEAVAFCERIGFEISRYEVGISEELGRGIIGLAENGTIWLSLEAFKHQELELTLIEEFVHLRNKVLDNTREMQNVLFREIVRVGRALVEAEGEAYQPPVVSASYNDDDMVPF